MKIMILNEIEIAQLLQILQDRFDQNMYRHPEILWSDLKISLLKEHKILYSLSEMQRTGGEPDLVVMDGFDSGSRDLQFLYVDCSLESPIGRRSLCYDQQALDARKVNKPVDCVENLALFMGVDVLDEQVYRELQKRFSFDLKTSSWIKTPNNIRTLGGALFCDRRYGETFTYHNGAESYYASRGFRAMMSITMTA